MRIFSLPLILSLCFCIQSIAQTPNLAIGAWKSHTPGRICKTIDATENFIYAASENNILKYSISDNTIISLSKLDGLSDINASYIRYNATSKTLIIGYTSGNFDLINSNGISPVNDIYRANIVGSKRINHIEFYNQYAYISTGFGVVVYDILKKEVKETYSSIGVNGSIINAKSVCIKNDSIFIATDAGLMLSKINSKSNLLDPISWYIYPTNGKFTTNKITYLASNNSGIYASTSDSLIFKLTSSNQWTQTSFNAGFSSIYSLKSSQGKITISGGSKITVINSDGTFQNLTGYNKAQESVYDSQNKLWTADLENGIVDNAKVMHIVNGPYSRSTFKMNFFVDNSGTQNLIATSAGYNASGIIANTNYNGFYLYRNGVWENYNGRIGNVPNTAYLSGSYNPYLNAIQLATYNGLVMCYRTGVENCSTKTYISSNTLPDKIEDLIPGNNAYFMYDVASDKVGTSWVSMYRVNSAQYNLYKFNSKEEFKGYNFPTVGNGIVSNFPVELMIDDNNNKWLRYAITRGAGLLVFNENNPTNSQFKYVTDQAGNGNLSHINVNCLAKSLKGDVWVGTDKGVCVFYNPSKILTSESFDATLPIIGNKPLLRDQVVKAIAVDGANRKWIGTASGAYLVNEDGTEQLLHFTSENSILPSDNIYDIKVNYVSGEVFFATDGGIVSYRSDATLGAEIDLNGKYNAIVFPNPVLPDYEGMITINNLPANINVKITDINGVLVYETTSNGGTATWNGITINGNKADTGIYLVLASNIDGSQVVASKFSIIK